MTIDGSPLVDTDDAPLVTIVTIVFNNAASLPKAMASVLAQSYRHIEYIVIDGGSDDGSVDVIRRFADRLSYWHSARDRGISDAFNQGVSLAKGRLVGLVNSDDWLDPGQVEAAVAALLATNAPFIFGDLTYHRRDGTAAFRVAGDADYASKLWHRMPQVTHPTAVVRREIYQRLGLFDVGLRIGMDYDWLARLNRAGVVGLYTPTICGHMSLGGVSDTRWRECLAEHEAIALRHGANATVIRWLFALRRLKIRIRMIAERWLPARLSLFVRNLVNRSIRKLPT